jgi:hypothetical protein
MKIASVLTCLFCLSQPLLAHSNCVQVKATLVDVCVPGAPACTGTITQGGILNGTTVTVFTGGANPTPDPNTFSFTHDLTITTILGQLKYHAVNLFNVANGVASGFGSIDPNASTGRFAGATGVLFESGKTVSFGPPFTIKLDITGEICLAN